eukprot:6437488-Amphidinium_carterae.1
MIFVSTVGLQQGPTDQVVYEQVGSKADKSSHMRSLTAGAIAMPRLSVPVVFHLLTASDNGTEIKEYRFWGSQEEKN